ncbi:MAG: eco57IR: type restriction enzyme Eco57I [Gemmatimonadetes bacterium]|nr:eco57IR: type restriction enzyme Eco57I [Gemmatimonadota bacterium]
MPAPAAVLELVERFRRNREAYKDPTYNETQLRREFVDPLFEALGWDVNNRRGYAEAYKDVVHEDSIRIAGRPRSPDYSFRIGGVRKFFVETKKPAVNVRTDVPSAFQLRRYAWSAHLPVSILTDFEEFAVYDARARPRLNAKASEARIFYITHEEYDAEWDRLINIFSPEAIRRGELDRFVKEAGRKRGADPVDDVFLEEIENWRALLAKNIAARNGELSADEVNVAVQMTVDRIVFLRIAEDRGLEDYGHLAEAAEKDGVYSALGKLFRRADDRYNSGLFHFEPERGRPSAADTFTLRLDIDDKPLRDIIGSLYYPESPYAFSVLPADILGQVYERFLGKVIRLTPGHRAVIEDKPEVRKAGGVYYTPTYVVDDIVGRTLGPLLADRRPVPATRGKETGANIRIVDPACGSGSFLLGAYQFLLDWHLDWYLANDPGKWARQRQPRLVQVRSDEWRLTIDERKRILLQSIYGVDIDAQAVEVTKLSLLLKVLEGETQQTVQTNLALYNGERALPDLDANIRRGNSIIDADFFSGRLALGGEDDPYSRIRPFTWDEEFPAIFRRKNAGFDAVIGNPPYVLMQSLEEPMIETYLAHKYRAARYKIDTYHVFMERGIDLLRDGGRLGYITPSSFLRNKFARNLREVILEKTEVDTLRVFKYPVFRDASVDTCETILVRRMAPARDHQVSVISSQLPEDVTEEESVPQSGWASHPDKQFGLVGGAMADSLAAALDQRSIPLGDFATAYFGIQTFAREAYVTDWPATKNHRPVIDGVNIGRYRLAPPKEFVDFQPRSIKSGGNADVYAQARIGVRQIGEVPIATLVPPGLLTLNTIYNVYLTRDAGYDLRFVLGVMSSQPIRWYWRQANFDQKRTFPKIKKDALLGIPIPQLDFTKSADRASQQAVVAMVDELIGLGERLAKAKTPDAIELVERRARLVDRELDAAVAKLFGLSKTQVEFMAAAERRDDVAA